MKMNQNKKASNKVNSNKPIIKWQLNNQNNKKLMKVNKNKMQKMINLKNKMLNTKTQMKIFQINKKKYKNKTTYPYKHKMRKTLILVNYLMMFLKNNHCHQMNKLMIKILRRKQKKVTKNLKKLKMNRN